MVSIPNFQDKTMDKKTLTIATRESQLALWQANWVAKCLQKAHPELTVQLLAMSTQADRAPYLSLQQIGGKGLFVKELEEAILDGRADIAVHCMKDMPMLLPPGLCITAMTAREVPFDVLVSNKYSELSELPQNAVVGTSSLRRQSQLLHLRPDLQVNKLRGNVITRLAKLDSGEYDAIILAAAGLKRLGFLPRMNEVLASDDFLPAAGQGVLGIECRVDDVAAQALVKVLNNETSVICVTAERALCKKLGAQCQTSVAAFAEVTDESVLLKGFVGSEDGKSILLAQRTGKSSDPEGLGALVGEDLLKQGAAEILAACGSG
jgi:hydroxymethylbilane synthase